MGLKPQLLLTSVNKRRIIASIYNKELNNTSLVLPKINKHNFDVYHLYTVYHNKRSIIIKELEKVGIQTRIIYPYPIHKMKGYKKNFPTKSFKISEIKSKGIFSLPIYPDLKIKDVFYICNSLKKILSKLS